MKRPSKSFLFLIGGSMLYGMLGASGIFGIHYPRTIENNPLTNPIEIKSITDEVLTLANGQSFAIDNRFRWEEDSYDQQVELQQLSNGNTLIFGKRRFFPTCATPWASIVRIPLIPVDNKKWMKFQLGFGTEIKESGQP